MVGYEDPSYFSRDYKKQFGAPPQRDISALRNKLEVKARATEDKDNQYGPNMKNGRCQPAGLVWF